MSKYVKYISSTHYGAPIIKGDRHGYLVGMLRTVLCTGFNERSDITKIECLSEKTFKVYFFSEHGYSKNQTVQIKNSYINEFNGEHVVISNTATDIIVESYVNNLAPMIDSVFDGFSNVSIKVAPLGFIEAFKEGDRSAFTTDEREAYLYVDDRTPPGWIESGGRTPPCTPIVAMTDSMVDIDTMGRYIVPFVESNPDWVINNNYTRSGQRRVGLWNWYSFGANSTNILYHNTVADRNKQQHYQIIGNGRLFYLIMQDIFAQSSTTSTRMYCFGKVCNTSNPNILPYILKAECGHESYNVWHYVDFYQTYNNLITNSTTKYSGLSTDVVGTNTMGLLKYDNSISNTIFSPTMGWIGSSNMYSGGNGPSFINTENVFNVSTINIFGGNVNKRVGNISGLTWIYSSTNVAIEQNCIQVFSDDVGELTRMYFTKQFGSLGSSTASTFTYGISLDYKDWYNYE